MGSGTIRQIARTRAPERGAGPPQFEVTEAKLFRPPIRAGIVRRNELVERLCASDTASVVAITAPAGYGKTTLLAEWAERDRRPFAWVSVDHHNDGKIALLARISGADEQGQLIENDPDRFYRPPYFGAEWIGIRLDLGDTDWLSIDDWLHRSWRSVAPKKLTSLMDAADEF